jgi:hypothetical protein
MFVVRIDRWALGHRPALEDATSFEPEVVVELRGIVFLNHEA